jgi:hypothetical protein
MVGGRCPDIRTGVAESERERGVGSGTETSRRTILELPILPTTYVLLCVLIVHNISNLGVQRGPEAKE